MLKMPTRLILSPYHIPGFLDPLNHFWWLRAMGCVAGIQRQTVSYFPMACLGFYWSIHLFNTYHLRISMVIWNLEPLEWSQIAWILRPNNGRNSFVDLVYKNWVRLLYLGIILINIIVFCIIFFYLLILIMTLIWHW